MVEENAALSPVDREIVDILGCEGRISFRELGERVHLSANTVAERVRRLVERGVISGFHAAVSQAALGRGLAAFIDVRLLPGVVPESVEPQIAALEQVAELVDVTGRFDYLLRVACRDAADLNDVLAALREFGAAETETRLVLRDLSGTASG